MVKQLVLFEHAAGYAVFELKEFEEIGAFQAQVEASITELPRFNSVLKLAGFYPFKNAANALENINSVSEGIVSDDLLTFLKQTLPKSLKKGKVILGVFDPKLGASLSEALPPLQCSHVGIFPEILRGIRLHFPHLMKNFTAKSSATAQLGLGHAYSRAKIKFNVNRVDNMIIQSIALLDMLDKDINTFSMRIREWYSYHFPELIKIVPENYTFARLVQLIRDRKNLDESLLDKLEEITMDSAKAEAIIEASKSSMGMDISELDLINIEMFASRVIGLSNFRKQLSEYLGNKMDGIAPNLATLVGDQVGARLIAHAGSLINLAKYPASTVQILGAEKALFRALKTRTNTPKYGLLYHSTFIGRAATKNKGRISRYLANKCSIASRIDCFIENPTKVFGEKLRQQVEDRLKFYEVGEVPKKNIDVMKEAILEVSQLMEAEKSVKKKKKDKKRKLSENGSSALVEEDEPVKKKKKKKDLEESFNGEGSLKKKVADESLNDGEEESPKKKKKKKTEVSVEEVTPIKKKKNKSLE